MSKAMLTTYTVAWLAALLFSVAVWVAIIRDKQRRGPLSTFRYVAVWVLSGGQVGLLLTLAFELYSAWAHPILGIAA